MRTSGSSCLFVPVFWVLGGLITRMLDLLKDALSTSDLEVSNVLSKDQEMIFPRNAVVVHVQVS